MKRAVLATLDDLRGGRQSWRVSFVLAVPALLAGFLNVMVTR